MKNHYDIQVRKDHWEKLRKLCEIPHEHCDGMNECAICDEPLVECAVTAIENLQSILRQLITRSKAVLPSGLLHETAATRRKKLLMVIAKAEAAISAPSAPLR